MEAALGALDQTGSSATNPAEQEGAPTAFEYAFERYNLLLILARECAYGIDALGLRTQARVVIPIALVVGSVRLYILAKYNGSLVDMVVMILILTLLVFVLGMLRGM